VSEEMDVGTIGNGALNSLVRTLCSAVLLFFIALREQKANLALSLSAGTAHALQLQHDGKCNAKVSRMKSGFSVQKTTTTKGW
jgi:hypothetical protein